MKNERLFCKCAQCGNLIGFVENSGVSVFCCGEPMEELKPNTVDAAHEKHVPALSVDDGMLTITVGSVPHPMTDAHHIDWVCVADGDRTTRIKLAGAEAARAVVPVGDKPVTVYAYCNLHGLWSVSM